MTVAEPLPGVAETAVGAPGAVGPRRDGFDGAEGGPVPTPLLAVTVKV